MKSIKAIISSLRVAMTDARQNESHFESWMILNEAICDAIEALAEQPAQQERMNNELAMREPSAIRDRLIQAGWTPPTQQPAQQEPVAWMCHPFGDAEVEYGPHQQCENCIPLYTSPPTLSLAQRKPLTDERIFELASEHQDWDRNLIRVRSFARAIEAAHGIKENT